MSKAEKMNRIMRKESNAILLLKIIVKDYGARDTVDCLYYNLNDADQDRFLNMALQEVGE